MNFWQRLGLQSERVLAERETPAGKLTVRDRAGFREMVATREGRELIWTRSSLSDPAVSGWPYIELFHVAAARAKERTRALFIGCGGAVAVRQFARMYAGIQLDVVDCDADVIALAREHFALDAIPNVHVHVADGADHVARAPQASWDIVVIDAYDASDMGVAFSTHAFFATVARALRPGGALALNVIGTLGGRGPFERTHRALATELADVRIHPVTTVGERLAGDTQRNIVITAVRPRHE
jgi:spermidine synthase